MQSARLLPLRLSRHPCLSRQHLRRRAISCTTGRLHPDATARGAHTISYEDPTLKRHKDHGTVGSTVDIGHPPHFTAHNADKSQHDEYISSPSLVQEDKSVEALIARRPSPTKRTADPFGIRNHRARSNHAVASSPDISTRSRVEQRAYSRATPASMRQKPKDDDDAAMSQKNDWGWGTNDPLSSSSLDKPSEGRPAPSSDSSPVELHEGRLFHLSTAAEDELRRLDMFLPRPEGEAPDVTGGAWRDKVHAPDGVAGLPMNRYFRKIRQQVRALVELAARQGTAASSAVARGAAGNGEAPVTGLSMREIEERATQQLRAKLELAFKPQASRPLKSTAQPSKLKSTKHAQRSGQPVPGQAYNERSSTLPADLISRNRNENQGPQHLSEKRMSLVEELFPDKIAQDDTPDSDGTSVPRLHIRAAQAPISQNEGQMPSTSRRRQEALKQQHAFEELGEEPTVLLLRNASTSLVEEDFRRLIPKGKHIQEWQGNGQYVKVIPGRNLETYERLNHYYIIFPDYASAQQYQRNARKAHAVAQKHTQSSFLSAIPPPPGYEVNGEDVDALKKSFSLLPMSQDLQLNAMMAPYGPSLKLMMVEGELPRLAEIQHKHRVLLIVEGTHQHTADIQRYIHLLGRERGLAYELVEADDAIKQLGPKRREASKKIVEHEREEDDADEPAYTEDQPEKEASSQSWVISFVNGAEAKRFERASHGRLFPVFSQSATPQERPSKMTAEYLW